MVKIVAVCNQKGGVGKTAISINLAAALGQQEGTAILLVDLDPQGHATEGVGMKELYTREVQSLYDGLTQPKVTVDSLVHPVPHEPFFLLPSHYRMMLAEQTLQPARGREYKLSALLEGLNGTFDWIVVDCPPNLGILTDNAIYAARRLVVPVQAEQTSMRALDLLLDQVESIEEGLKIKVEMLAVVPNLVQDSTLSKRILADLRENIPVTTPFEFRKRVVLQEAYEQGRSLFSLQADRSKMPAINELKELYFALAKLVRERSNQDGK